MNAPRPLTLHCVEELVQLLSRDFALGCLICDKRSLLFFGQLVNIVTTIIHGCQELVHPSINLVTTRRADEFVTRTTVTAKWNSQTTRSRANSCRCWCRCWCWCWCWCCCWCWCWCCCCCCCHTFSRRAVVTYVPVAEQQVPAKCQRRNGRTLFHLLATEPTEGQQVEYEW